MSTANEALNTQNISKEKFKDNRDLATLLDYYRIKLDNFDKERQEWLLKLESLRQTIENHHKLEWEIQTRNEEVLNLQINKTNITNTINIERQRVLQLTNELEFYKERSNQDRRRIVQLLKLTEPIDQQVVLYHNKRPEKLEKFSSVNSSNGFNNKNTNTSMDFKRVNNMPVDLNKSTILYYTSDNNTINNTNNTIIKRNNSSNMLNNSMLINNNSSSPSHNTNLNTNCTIKNNYCDDTLLNSKINISINNPGMQIQQNRSLSRGRQIKHINSSNSQYKKLKQINNYNSLSKSHKNLESRIRPNNEKQHIVRSLILPNYEEKTELIDEIDFLKKQIVEIRTFYEDIIHKQSIYAKEHEEELKLHIENERSKYAEVLETKHKAEAINSLLTKELLTYKCEYAKNEKRVYEELDLLKLQNQALISAMKELSTIKDLDKENYLVEQERKNKQILGFMRNQVKNYQENIRIMKEQYKQIQNVFNQRMNELIEKYNRLFEQKKEIEERLRKSDAYYNKYNRRRDSKDFDNMNLLISEINDINKRIKKIENIDFSKNNNSLFEKDLKKSCSINKNTKNSKNISNNDDSSVNNDRYTKSKSLSKISSTAVKKISSNQGGNSNVFPNEDNKSNQIRNYSASRIIPKIIKSNAKSKNNLDQDKENAKNSNNNNDNNLNDSEKEVKKHFNKINNINNNTQIPDMARKSIDSKQKSTNNIDSHNNISINNSFKNLNTSEIKKKLKLNVKNLNNKNSPTNTSKLLQNKDKIVDELKKQFNDIETRFSKLKEQ